MKFTKLFEPVKIGKVEIKNRIAMAPMGIGGLVDHNGGLSARAIDYYAERAYGGVGLIISTVAKVNEMEPRYGVPFVSPRSISTWGEMAENLHHFSSKIFVQLTAGFGRVMAGHIVDRGFKLFSASEIPAYWRPDAVCRPLSTEEVEGIVKDLANAASLLKDAGVDGVELHGHEGYLFDQFTTSLWNKRTDKYGGDLINRLRFPIEVLNAIKNKASTDFPVIYRYGLKHYVKAPWQAALSREGYAEAGRDVAEGLEMARMLEKAGFDALHVDAGSYDSWYWAHPPTYQPHGCMVDMAAAAKKAVGIPVISVGRLDDPALAEKVLQEGKADIVAIGRGLLADPHWPKKVRQGNLREIIPCTGCHDGCINRMLVHFKSLSCAVNPCTGREKLNIVQRATDAQKVVVAGGGVAGMEAARVSAVKGHKVVLFEKSDKLGGHLIAASVPDFKRDYLKLMDWYKYQLKKLGVDIRLNTEATAASIKDEKPDKVFIATGSVPVIPEVPGIEKPITATCSELLLGNKKAGAKVAVMGGGLVGCETAVWLAGQGKKVTVVETLPQMAAGVFHANRIMLLDMLAEKGIECLNNTSLLNVTDDGVNVIGGNFKKKLIKCNTVALAVGLKPRNELYEQLRREFTELYLIGDSREPRKIMDAIWDGFYVASR